MPRGLLRELERELPRAVTLPELRARPELQQMVLLRRSRLSVQPVTRDEWQLVLRMAREASPPPGDRLC